MAVSIIFESLATNRIASRLDSRKNHGKVPGYAQQTFTSLFSSYFSFWEVPVLFGRFGDTLGRFLSKLYQIPSESSNYGENEDVKVCQAYPQRMCPKSYDEANEDVNVSGRISSNLPKTFGAFQTIQLSRRRRCIPRTCQKDLECAQKAKL